MTGRLANLRQANLFLLLPHLLRNLLVRGQTLSGIHRPDSGAGRCWIEAAGGDE